MKSANSKLVAQGYIPDFHEFFFHHQQVLQVPLCHTFCLLPHKSGDVFDGHDPFGGESMEYFAFQPQLDGTAFQFFTVRRVVWDPF